MKQPKTFLHFYFWKQMFPSPKIEAKDTDQYLKAEYWNCWKLKTHNGRQVWEFEPTAEFDEINFSENNSEVKEFLEEMGNAFEFDKTENPNSGDKVYRAQSLKNFQELLPDKIEIPKGINRPIQKEAFLSAFKGLNFYKSLQADEGHWPGDYGGPMFLLPGLIIASSITETSFPLPHRELMKRYMLNHQNEDGGWGLHIEGQSTMFGTVMQYVALRLLGMKSDIPPMEKSRKWIHQHGGADGIPSWGKFYLAVLGVYEWEGCNSLLPEMWLLPKSLPMHPWRYWCHSRMVYLPMAYCYGKRITSNITPLIKELRGELYTTEYQSIQWKSCRDLVADTDLYTSQSFLLKILNRFINHYEQFHSTTERKRALNFILEYINAEDEQTDYVDIGPVNQIINSICIWHAYGKDSPQFKKHVERWKDYLWVAEDGMKMSGYNGSQLWDTAFAVQALTEGELEKIYPEVVKKAYHYLDISQVQEDVHHREKFFRHISKGGWPFSTLEHGWPISDCTAEGLNATLKAHHSKAFRNDVSIKKIPEPRLFDAVNVILSFQNKDGGWATYENTRGKSWLELLNPSGIFGKIMIDCSYTECTSACIRALCEFRNNFPSYRTNEIAQSIRKGIEFIKTKQLPDGSWLGSWAICFTYGTWFGVEALIAAGENSESFCIQNACSFILSKQNKDGGWGESFESCVQKKYVPHKNSQVVNTSWALLALMAAKYPNKKSVEKGIQFLIQRQQANGDWEQEGISGVFNANCMITYTSYRNIFPMWALSRFFNNYRKRVI